MIARLLDWLLDKLLGPDLPYYRLCEDPEQLGYWWERVS